MSMTVIALIALFCLLLVSVICGFAVYRYNLIKDYQLSLKENTNYCLFYFTLMSSLEK